MTNARLSSFVSICLLLVPFAAWIPVALGQSQSCDLLPIAKISEIIGRPAHAQPASAGTHDSEPKPCVYRDSTEQTEVWLFPNDSEADARTRLQGEVEHRSGRESPTHLLGIGTEARLIPSADRKENAVVARYDTTVLVVSGRLDQASLVALARSVIAALDAQPHRTHP